jgi:hypothetical protein
MVSTGTLAGGEQDIKTMSVENAAIPFIMISIDMQEQNVL